MTIEFVCECGKAFKVADEYAGKRSKCTACGKPVVVPAPAAEEAAGATVADESAEDAALRALTEGDDPEPAPRAAGRYARHESSPPAPRPPTTPARKDPPPTYRPPAAPRKGQSSPNWAKVVGGVAMAALGVLIGVGAVAVLLSGGRVSVWLLVVPVLFVLASPFFVIDGFRDRVKK